MSTDTPRCATCGNTGWHGDRDPGAGHRHCHCERPCSACGAGGAWRRGLLCRKVCGTPPVHVQGCALRVPTEHERIVARLVAESAAAQIKAEDAAAMTGTTEIRAALVGAGPMVELATVGDLPVAATIRGLADALDFANGMVGILATRVQKAEAYAQELLERADEEWARAEKAEAENARIMQFPATFIAEAVAPMLDRTEKAEAERDTWREQYGLLYRETVLPLEATIGRVEAECAQAEAREEAHMPTRWVRAALTPPATEAGPA